MSQHRTIDLLRKAREFHTKLRDYYQNTSKDADKEDVRILLEFMSRHEEALNKAIQHYEEHAPAQILERYFRFTHPERIDELFDNLDIKPDMGREEVVDLSLKLDQALLEIYEQLHANAESDELREATGDLLELEHRENIRKMRATLDLHE